MNPNYVFYLLFKYDSHLSISGMNILRKKYNALNENATDTRKSKYLSNGQELSSTANINEPPPILPI